LNDQLSQAQKAAADAARAKDEMQRTRSELERERERRLAAERKGHSWPPFIKISDAEGYRFASGDASISKAFEEKLSSQVVPRILAIINEYDADVIEIVGHTDEQPIHGLTSTLDADTKMEAMCCSSPLTMQDLAWRELRQSRGS
jgi:flagellar motor protein MotB